tara:strand:+ start:865 stop:1899 length:1035 start_codon:yes stop_codon:yes gene_type:complete
MDSTKEHMSLQKLLDEPKGKTKYFEGQSFLLHVFWEAPNRTAAEKVLSALQRCALATQRDTPCVPTYFFRISTLDSDLVSVKPMTLSQNPQLSDAQKKLKVGVPRLAVFADMIRRGIDPQLLDLDPSSILPESMQEAPIMLECTEIYLDERSFYEHAGSKDYLQAYGEVMTPGLQNSQITIRLGTPTEDIVDKILEPMLKERVESLPGICTLWQKPATSPQTPMLLAMDVSGDIDQVAKMLPQTLKEVSTTLVAFSHPLRRDTVRVLSFQPTLANEEMMRRLATLPLAGIEVHCEKSDYDAVQRLMTLTRFKCRNAIVEVQCGYLIHRKAAEVTKVSDESSTGN